MGCQQPNGVVVSLLLGFALLFTSEIHAFEPFDVETIRVDGLQRIAVGTVFNYLPLQVGDRLDIEGSSRAIRALYKTGFFKDVVLEREGNTLVIFVAERPAIANIEVSGNDVIPDEQLDESLKQLGLTEGRVLDRSLLDKVSQELKRQYLSMGKYSVEVQTTSTPLERNRVAVSIDIFEGEVSTIQLIRIIGNQVFDEQTLLDEIELGSEEAFSLFSSRHEYSKQKLLGDLETLSSYYKDRGYINFRVKSTQVSITPDRAHIYITVNLHEGLQYTIGEVQLNGELHLPEEELRKGITTNSGETFSQRKLTDTARAISERLGDEGYPFANVNPVPEIDDKSRQVALTYYIDPGRRAYVRRVNIDGNYYTKDEVMRRELRQMEGGVLSLKDVRRSRTRLERLGYFSQVNVETPTVPGSPDLVDVNFSVVESETFGSLNFGVGYGEDQGVLLTLGVNQSNFLGSGKSVNLGVKTSNASKSVRASVKDPYFTLDGISFRYDIYYNETDAGKLDTSDYLVDRLGVGIDMGIPLSENDSLTYGITAEQLKIRSDSDTSETITDFCTEFAGLDECEFISIRPGVGWVHDTRNRAIFATSGGKINLSMLGSVSVSEHKIDYYKINLKQSHFFPVSESVAFSPRYQMSYGSGFGELETLPPWERYYAGGISKVRGYKVNSLGPRDSSGDTIGGNLRVMGSLELFMVPPFAEKSKSTRLSLFLDGGNVYANGDFDSDELRYSAGIGFQWFTPVGPMVFSIANALNAKDGDETESFQFTLGTGF